MRVVIINGQNHKGSTYHMGRILAEKITDEANICEFFLPRDMPHFCCGCTRCFIEDETLCPHYDYIKPITQAMDMADVLIFTSPVYVYHATGSMKALLDHYGFRWMVHRPEERMFSKQAVCLSTAAGGGMKSTCKDIKDSMFFWGIGKIYCYGAAVRAISWKEVSEKTKQKIEKKTDILADKIIKTNGKVRIPIKTRIFFNFVRFLQKKEWNPKDVAYWKEKGWNKKKRPWK